MTRMNVCMFGLTFMAWLQSTRGHEEQKPDHAIGTENFETVRHSQFFVDKTMMIDDIARGGSKIVLITYPRRWGKSMNLSMLKHFCGRKEFMLEAESLFKGTEIDEKRESCQLAWSMFGKYPLVYIDFKLVRSRDYMDFLKSMKETIAMTFKGHQSIKKLLQSKSDAADLAMFKEYSQTNFMEHEIRRLEDQVNALNDLLPNVLKEVTNATNDFNEIHRKYRQCVYQDTILPNITTEEAARRNKKIKSQFSPMMKSAKTCLAGARRNVNVHTKEKKDLRDKIADIQRDIPRRLEEHIENSLHFLTNLLMKTYGLKTVVLVDEYDQVMNKLFLEVGDDALLDKVTDMFKRLLTKLFKYGPEDGHLSDAIQFSVVTGVFRISKANLFSGLNCIVEYSMLWNKFYKHYGFTKTEVANLLQHAFRDKRLPTTITAEQLAVSFDGYRVSNDISMDLFNPWSIVNSLENNRIDYALTLSGTMESLKRLFFVPEFQPMLRNLFSGGVEKIKLESLQFEVNDLKRLSIMIHQGVQDAENGKNLFLRLLFSTGYISLVSHKENSDPLNCQPDKFWFVKIANEEMRSHMIKLTLKYYIQKHGIDTGVLDNASAALAKLFGRDDTGEFENAFYQLLRCFKSLTKDPKGKGFYYNESYIQDALAMVVFNEVAKGRGSCFHFAGTEVQFVKRASDSAKKSNMRPDCILFRKDLGVVLLIETKEKISPEEGLADAESKYGPVFDRFDDVKVKQYLGITCNFDKKSKKIKSVSVKTKCLKI